MRPTTRQISLAFLALAIVVAAFVYLPGISGPYVFDDRYNIVKNSYVKIDSLAPRELYYASFSVGAGPLLRPVSMFSFAVNYYFAGSFENTTPFKLTNLAIHIVNGLLVFWLMRLVFARLAHIGPPGDSGPRSLRGLDKTDLLAAAVALLWVVHPINLTSVLYIVQRMTELSSLFTLIGLICYLKGRVRIVSGRGGGLVLIGLGVFAAGGLGILSKENAALLPLFILAIEFTLFAHERPWRTWSQLSPPTKAIMFALLLGVATAVLLSAIDFALPGYGGRSFTLLERLLTEARVLFFYLFLLLIPRINAFGLHHDDIHLSTSLFDPWTTIACVTGIVALLMVAYLTRKKLPLLSLGILWFFIGHLMESTILPLEIAHEHRNYLAGVGILLAIVYLLDYGTRQLGHKLWFVYPVVIVVFASTTLLRATQWADYDNLTRYEAFHHPNSARTQAMRSSALYVQGDYKGALDAIRRAAAVAPQEPGYKMNMHVLAARLGVTLSPTVQEEILENLASRNPSVMTQMSLDSISACIATDCTQLQAPMESWLTTLLENVPPSFDVSFFYHLLGRTLVAQGRILEGLNAFERAIQTDPNYLHPLFELAAVFVQLRQVENAELILERLRKANETNLHPRDKEIAELAATIEALRDEMRPES